MVNNEVVGVSGGYLGPQLGNQTNRNNQVLMGSLLDQYNQIGAENEINIGGIGRINSNKQV